MKKISAKEIIILIIATAVIVVSGVIIWRVLFPAPKTSTGDTGKTVNTLSTDIDQNTLKRIDTLSDYGQPSLDNIGKSDLFAN